MPAYFRSKGELSYQWDQLVLSTESDYNDLYLSPNGHVTFADKGYKTSRQELPITELTPEQCKKLVNYAKFLISENNYTD